MARWLRGNIENMRRQRTWWNARANSNYMQIAIRVDILLAVHDDTRAVSRIAAARIGDRGPNDGAALQGMGHFQSPLRIARLKMLPKLIAFVV